MSDVSVPDVYASPGEILIEPVVYGDPRMSRRWWVKIEVMPNGCWRWKRHLQGGYGTYRYRGKGKCYAHRVAFEVFNGKKLGQLLACHTCDHPWCVNPFHIRADTPAANMADCVEGDRHQVSERTHCRAGHEYQPGDGPKRCGICAVLRRSRRPSLFKSPNQPSML